MNKFLGATLVFLLPGFLFVSPDVEGAQSRWEVFGEENGGKEPTMSPKCVKFSPMLATEVEIPSWREYVVVSRINDILDFLAAFTERANDVKKKSLLPTFGRLKVAGNRKIRELCESFDILGLASHVESLDIQALQELQKIISSPAEQALRSYSDIEEVAVFCRALWIPLSDESTEDCVQQAPREQLVETVFSVLDLLQFIRDEYKELVADKAAVYNEESIPYPKIMRYQEQFKAISFEKVRRFCIQIDARRGIDCLNDSDLVTLRTSSVRECRAALGFFAEIDEIGLLCEKLGVEKQSAEFSCFLW